MTKPRFEPVNISELLPKQLLPELYSLEWNPRMSAIYGTINDDVRIPNRYYYENVNETELFNNLKKEFPGCFYHYNEKKHSSDKCELQAFFYIIRKDLFVHFESNDYRRITTVVHRADINQDEILYLEKIINDSKVIKSDKKYFHLLTSPAYGLDLKKVEMPDQHLNLETHYNDDFLEFNDYIINAVKSQRKSGKIVLMNGLYGTGKTFYIRNLISTLDLEFVYLSTSMAMNLDKPELTDLLFQLQGNKAIVIEDAESLIGKRNDGNGLLVSSILNLSDGIIGDSLNIKLIVVTCNSKITDLDPAILRKGRLLAHYEFGKLKKEKAQNLSNILGMEREIAMDLTLADVYNQDVRGLDKKPESIGFRSQN